VRLPYRICVCWGIWCLRISLPAWQKSTLEKSSGGDDFYQAKLGVARFYFARLLPETAMLIRQARSGAGTLMAMDADLF